MNPALALHHVSKHFGPTLALADVSLAILPGQVHALLGENGAGKSTLMHIAFGLVHPDAGSISVRDPDGVVRDRAPFASPRAARAAGIGMVHQHFTSIAALTVAENIALAAGWRDTGRSAERRATEVTTRLGLKLPVSDYVEGLSVQLRQRLEIAKALASDARILLLDEPTAVLAPRETAELLRFVRAFAATGGATVLITHKLDEVLRVADRVTILRRGEVTLDAPIGGQTPQSLSRAMIGGDLPGVGRITSAPGKVTVRAVGARIAAGVTSPASFDIRAGEIVGLAAIDGNGQRELMRAIAAVDDVTVTSGELAVTGPVAFIPEDRTTEGLIGSFTLAENLLLGTLDRRTRWLDWRAIRQRTTDLLRGHDIRAASAAVPAGTLSGGNQQKFVVARALEGRPRVIVAEDPTRGLDVMATAAIHQRLREAARNGAAVVLYSSDLDEVLEMADRLFVVARGRVRELPIDTARDLVGDAMLGLEPVA